MCPISRSLDLEVKSTNMAANYKSELRNSPQRNEMKEKLIVEADFDALYHCDICSDTFATKEGYNAHINYHMEIKATCNESTAVANHYSDNEGQDMGTGKTSGSNQRKRNSSKTVVNRKAYLAKRPVCDVCNKSFANHNVLKVHMRRHTGERPYVCTLCDRRFAQMNTLTGHMATHDREQHKCQICHRVFTQIRILKSHLSKYHSEERERKRNNLLNEHKVMIDFPAGTKPKTMFKCDICSKLCFTSNQLVIHRRIHTGERPFVCEVCGKGFKQKITLKDHKTTHSSEKPFECEKCGSKYKQVRTLRRHQVSGVCDKILNRKNKMGAKIYPDTTAQVSKTVIDNNIEDDLIQHKEQDVESQQRSADVVKIDLPAEMDRCEDSENEPLNEGGEENSSQSNNSSAATPDESHPVSGASFVCEQCGKVFGLKKTLNQHIKTHSVERPYVCSVCNKGFRTRPFLMAHMKSHQAEKPFSCKVCQKQFRREKCLQMHIGRNICTGIRPHVCEVCNKSFMYPRFLKNHRCIITPRKIFECETCGKTFTRRNALTDHIRVHTGDRPFLCTFCNKTFAKSSLLRRHLLIHNESKRYECLVCKKRFTFKTTLNNHLAVHSVERNHVCPLCHKAFKQGSSLRNHMKLKHGPQSQSGAVPKTYLCANCGKIFRHLRWMLKHDCAMKGVKCFKCEICQKAFSKKQQLEVHSRTHTGERPYQCTECNRCFTQAGSLKDHMVTHTGVKVHECDTCGCKFTRKNSLRRHKLVIHTGVEPFMCGECGLTFKYQTSFKKHSASCVVKQIEPSEPEGAIPETAELMPDVPEVEHTDLEQVVLDNILGNIERAMNGAGIEIKDNVQYQIVVADANGEVTLHLGENPK